MVTTQSLRKETSYVTKMKESRKKIVLFSSLRALDCLSTYLKITSLMYKVLTRWLAFSLRTCAFFKQSWCTESTVYQPQCVYRPLPTHIKNVAFWDLIPTRFGFSSGNGPRQLHFYSIQCDSTHIVWRQLFKNTEVASRVDGQVF